MVSATILMRHRLRQTSVDNFAGPVGNGWECSRVAHTNAKGSTDNRVTEFTQSTQRATAS
jgi:hypothetical protein